MPTDDSADIRRLPIYDPRPSPAPVPALAWNEGPRRVLCVNAAWASHLLGVITRLERNDAWIGSEAEIDFAMAQLASITAALSTPFDGDCPVEYPETIEDGPATANPVVEVRTEYITEFNYIGGDCCQEECDLAPNCGVNPDHFRQLPTGEFQVLDGCTREWVTVATIVAAGMASPPPDVNPIIDPDDPPAPEEITACGKVASAINAFLDMLNAAESTYGVPGEFVGAVRDSIPAVEMGRVALLVFLTDYISYRKLYSFATLTDSEMVALMKCKAAVGVTPGTETASQDDYNYLVNSIKSAIYDTYDYLTATAVFTLWEQCYQTVGYYDTLLLMNLGALDTSEDCECLDQSTPQEPLPETTDGWYFGERIDIIATGDGDPVQLDFAEKHILPHDTYGYVFEVVTKTAGEPPYANFDNFTDSGGSGAYDIQFRDNGQLLSAGMKLIHAAQSVVDTINTAGYAGGGWVKEPLAGTEVAATDVLTDVNRNMPGEVVGIGGNIRGGTTQNLLIYIRFIHNTGSPSHA